MSNTGGAIGWYVYDQTRSAYALGFLGLCQFLPMVLLIFVAGHVADRMDRRRIVMLCQLIEAGVLASMTVGAHIEMKMLISVIVFEIATVVFCASRDLALSIVALFALGASDNVSVVIRSSLVQLSTPDEMRGRVNAVNSLFVGTSNQLDEFESGMTAGLLGPVGAGILGGVGAVLVALTWMRYFPKLRTLLELADVQPSQ